RGKFSSTCGWYSSRRLWITTQTAAARGSLRARDSQAPPAREAACVIFCLLLAGGAGAAEPEAFAAGKKAFAAGDYSQAVELFDRVQGEHRCEATFYGGVARYRLKRLDEAIIVFRSAGACDSRNPEPRIALAEAYLEKGDDNRGAAALEEALQLDP